MKVLEQALGQEGAQKGADMRAEADAAKREAIETAQPKGAEEKAKTDAKIRALEAVEPRLQQQREQEAARAHEEVQRRAAEAAIAAMEDAGRKIQRETPPGRSRVDTLRRFLDGDPASRTKINLDAEDSRSSEGSGPATRPRRKGKGKTPERPQRPAKRHPQNSDPFVTCSDGDRRDRGHRQEPTGCKVGVPGAVGGGGNDTPPSSGKEGPPPPYRSGESTTGRPPPGSRPRCREMDTDDNTALSQDTDPSGSGGPPDGGPPAPPGGGLPGGPPGGGPPG